MKRRAFLRLAFLGIVGLLLGARRTMTCTFYFRGERQQWEMSPSEAARIINDGYIKTLGGVGEVWV